MWQNHVQQNRGKNPNGTGKDMVRDHAERDGTVPLEPAVSVGHAIWSARVLAGPAAASGAKQMGGGRLRRAMVPPHKCGRDAKRNQKGLPAGRPSQVGGP
jgi:hypothetical protein